MSFIENVAKNRMAPDIMKFQSGRRVKTADDFDLRREELKKILSEHIYGQIPKKPDTMHIERTSFMENYAAGKATLSKFKMTLNVDGAEFSFPFAATVPSYANQKPVPAFVHINFRPDTPDRYMPLEEITDNGFAIFSFCYDDVTKDDDNFRDGVCKILKPNRRRRNAPGKLAIWAWAAMRIMDYIEGLDYIDLDNVAVVGHSRLGKTALLAGAFDNRFKYSISNDSGCGGAALTRGKIGETIPLILYPKSCWFCPRYKDYADDETKLPTDQHALLAVIAPRYVLVGSAKEDLWADPQSEFLSAHLASAAYKVYGLAGLIHEDKFPEANTTLNKGNICYHIREGKHYFSRYDWNVYMNYINDRIKNR